MSFEPSQTSFDLNFRLFGVHIRVSPWFWVMSALLGPFDVHNREGLIQLILWMVCVFVSILVHEFGHIFMGRLFGSDGHIVLYSFGGLAVGSNDLRSRWQRILVLLAGPGIQLVLAGGIMAYMGTVLPDSQVLWERLEGVQPGNPQLFLGSAVWDLWKINLYWAILNLLPVWPLDGGQVSREVLTGLMGGRGLRMALWLSFAVAAYLAVHALAEHSGHPIPPRSISTGGLYTALLFGLLAFNSFQQIQALGHYQPWDEDYGPRKW